MRNPHFFQKCCHFRWLCFDFSKNDNTFERNEDCATVFLKWTDFRKDFVKIFWNNKQNYWALLKQSLIPPSTSKGFGKFPNQPSVNPTHNFPGNMDCIFKESGPYISPLICAPGTKMNPNSDPSKLSPSGGNISQYDPNTWFFAATRLSTKKICFIFKGILITEIQTRLDVWIVSILDSKY